MKTYLSNVQLKYKTRDGPHDMSRRVRSWAQADGISCMIRSSVCPETVIWWDTWSAVSELFENCRIMVKILNLTLIVNLGHSFESWKLDIELFPL